ncbi:TPA: P2 family phage major capsid protein, partial [Aeromonas veronii]
TKPSEQIAAQQLAKSIAGRKAMIPPFFPGKRMVVTTLDNLHCYTQRGTRKRKADDNQDTKSFDNQYWRMEGYALGEHKAYGGFEEADIVIGADPAAPAEAGA